MPTIGGIGGDDIIVAHQGQPALSGAQLADDGELVHARLICVGHLFYVETKLV